MVFNTTEVQEYISITVEDIRNGVSKTANWKAAGPDLVQGLWFKKLTELHSRFQECLQVMVRGRTVLIQKDTAKGAQARKYRPIACLPMMWKLLTGVMGEKLYHHLERNGLLTDEQKGSRGTKDQLFVDKAILKNCRRRLKIFQWLGYTTRRHMTSCRIHGS